MKHRLISPLVHPVILADGKQKPIKDVKVGDQVLATDPQAGKTRAEPVVRLIRHTGVHAIIAVTLVDGSVLKSTSGHPIWDATQRSFVAAIVCGSATRSKLTLTNSSRSPG